MKGALVCWFTGLSGAGKSTIAKGILQRLKSRGINAALLDGDSVRAKGKPLNFTKADISRNNTRITDLCLKLLAQNDVVLVAAISPFCESRTESRRRIGTIFREIYVKASLQEVSTRDTKGLYKRARDGQLDNLIGFDPASPYEEPENPELIIDSANEAPQDSIEKTIAFIEEALTTAKGDGKR